VLREGGTIKSLDGGKIMKRKGHFTWVVVCAISALHTVARAQWTEPEPVTEINTEYRDKAPFLSFDGLTLYFDRASTNTFHYTRIYKATRSEPYGPFTAVEEISTLNQAGVHVSYAWVSPNNLRMYYYINDGRWKLKFTERPSASDPWLPGVNISELNALGGVANPSLSEDELTIVFAGYNLPGGQGDFDIWTATRPDIGSPFGNVTNLVGINSSASDGHPCIAPDGLTVYFTSQRSGNFQIFKAVRESLDGSFGAPEHLSFLDTPGGHSRYPCLSSDGTTFYFTRNLPSQKSDIWVSYLIPLEVGVDIKPEACPNPLNLASRGVLPAVISGSEDFDVNTIDVATIRLEGIAPIRSNYEDVATPVTDGNVCECNTEGADGYKDLTLKFKTQAIVEQIVNAFGDLVKDDELVLILTGTLTDGTPIEGTDCVRIVGRLPRSLAAKKADVNRDGIVDLFDFCTMTEYWLEPSAIDY
jgi:hypothetical protein